jgi:hypothetical protein
MAYSVLGYDTGRVLERRGGVWGYWKNVWVREGGVWQRMARFHTNIGKGAGEEWTNSVSWKPALVRINVFDDNGALDIYSVIRDETQFDPDVDPVGIELFVTSGKTLYSESVAHGAIYASSPLAARTELAITNQGNIFGSNGAGGNGGASWYPNAYVGEDGVPGGPALDLFCDTDIDNGSGSLFGGGGGGGGGGATWVADFLLFGLAGAGGGGNPGGDAGANRSDVTTVIEDGDDSVYSFAAGGLAVAEVFGAKGGDGGACLGAGEAGENGEAAQLSGGGSRRGGFGGALGSAAVLNGFDLNITAGDTPSQVKGAIT